MNRQKWDKRGGESVEKLDACVRIVQIESRSFLQIGKESVEVAGYKLTSADDGSVSLAVTIEGFPREFELSASLTVQK